jgi:hypothetical protein
MIIVACLHCQREAHFIGNPLFQLVSTVVWLVAIFHSARRESAKFAVRTFQSETSGNYCWRVFLYTRIKRERERGGGMLNVAEYLVTAWRYVFRGMRPPFIMIYHKYVSATCRFTVVRFSYLGIIVQGVPFILVLSAETVTRCYGCCKAFCFAEWQDERDTVVPLLPRTLVVVTWLHLPGIFVRRLTQNHLGLPQFVNPSATHTCAYCWRSW